MSEATHPAACECGAVAGRVFSIPQLNTRPEAFLDENKFVFGRSETERKAYFRQEAKQIEARPEMPPIPKTPSLMELYNAA